MEEQPEAQDREAQARAALLAKDFSTAVRLLTEAITLHPTDGRLYAERAEAFTALGLPAEAATDSARAVVFGRPASGEAGAPELQAPAQSAGVSTAATLPAQPAAPPWPTGGPGVLFAMLMAVTGGLLGILGALVQETRGGGLLAPFIGAPIIEEALKPVGVYLLLLKWPHLVSNRFPTACLSGLSGLSFGVIESTIYVFVYSPQHTHAFVVFRYTVDVALHGVCSFIVGLGINRGLIDSAAGRIPFLQGSRRYYITAMLLHGGFNVTVTVLTLLGYFKFLS